MLPKFKLSFQINLGIYLGYNKTELSVLVDRAVIGSSIVDGQIELMLHRCDVIFVLIYCELSDNVSAC